jgi:PAS domain-containing protein
VSVSTDNSERKQAERELAEKTALFEAILENMDEGISMVDADLNAVAFNRRFLELLEFPMDRFRPGDSFESFVRYNAERGEYGDGDIENALEGAS